MASKHARKLEARPPRVEEKIRKEFRLDSNEFGFICAGISNVSSYERSAGYNLSCMLQMYAKTNLSINE